MLLLLLILYKICNFYINFIFLFFHVFFFAVGLCRICHTKTSIGMRPVSCVSSAICRWWTNNSVLKPTRSTAAIVMMPNSHRVAMAVAKCSVLVSRDFKNCLYFKYIDNIYCAIDIFMQNYLCFKPFCMQRYILFYVRTHSKWNSLENHHVR